MMVEVWFVDGDKETFETKPHEEPWKWLPDQEVYLIPSVEGNMVIPAGFLKCLKHIEV